MNFKNELKSRYMIGTWCEIPTPYVSNIIAKSGIDFQIIDMEHGVFDFELAQNMIFAIKLENKTAIIRVPSVDENYVLRALDIGADGIIFPGIESGEQVDNIIKYCKYAPIGKKGFNPYVYTGGYNSVNSEFFNKRNKDLSIAIIIESVKGLNNLEKILQNDNIDIVYMGQYDLSVSLGVPGDVNNEIVNKALEKALDIVKKKNKVAGCMVHSVCEAKKMINKGFKFIVYKVDSGILYKSCNEFVKEVNND